METLPELIFVLKLLNKNYHEEMYVKMSTMNIPKTDVRTF